jgi:hypothetical protein
MLQLVIGVSHPDFRIECEKLNVGLTQLRICGAQSTPQILNSLGFSRKVLKFSVGKFRINVEL